MVDAEDWAEDISSSADTLAGRDRSLTDSPDGKMKRENEDTTSDISDEESTTSSVGSLSKNQDVIRAMVCNGRYDEHGQIPLGILLEVTGLAQKYMVDGMCLTLVNVLKTRLHRIVVDLELCK